MAFVIDALDEHGIYKKPIVAAAVRPGAHASLLPAKNGNNAGVIAKAGRGNTSKGSAAQMLSAENEVASKESPVVKSIAIL